LDAAHGTGREWCRIRSCMERDMITRLSLHVRGGGRSTRRWISSRLSCRLWDRKSSTNWSVLMGVSATIRPSRTWRTLSSAATAATMSWSKPLQSTRARIANKMILVQAVSCTYRGNRGEANGAHFCGEGLERVGSCCSGADNVKVIKVSDDLSCRMCRGHAVGGSLEPKGEQEGSPCFMPFVERTGEESCGAPRRIARDWQLHAQERKEGGRVPEPCERLPGATYCSKHFCSSETGAHGQDVSGGLSRVHGRRLRLPQGYPRRVAAERDLGQGRCTHVVRHGAARLRRWRQAGCPPQVYGEGGRHYLGACSMRPASMPLINATQAQCMDERQRASRICSYVQPARPGAVLQRRCVSTAPSVSGVIRVTGYDRSVR
jgi:hypothetical protein